MAENCKEESNIFVIPKIPENGNVFFCGVGYLELFYTMIPPTFFYIKKELKGFSNLVSRLNLCNLWSCFRAIRCVSFIWKRLWILFVNTLKDVYLVYAVERRATVPVTVMVVIVLVVMALKLLPAVRTDQVKSLSQSVSEKRQFKRLELCFV